MQRTASRWFWMQSKDQQIEGKAYMPFIEMPLSAGRVYSLLVVPSGVRTVMSVMLSSGTATLAELLQLVNRRCFSGTHKNQLAVLHSPNCDKLGRRAKKRREDDTVPRQAINGPALICSAYRSTRRPPVPPSTARYRTLGAFAGTPIPRRSQRTAYDYVLGCGARGRLLPSCTTVSVSCTLYSVDVVGNRPRDARAY